MKFPQPRLQNAMDTQTSTGSGSSTLMTEGANTTVASASDAPAETIDAKPLEGQAGETTQTSTDTEGKPADGKDETKAPEKVLPEKYEFKAPDGQTLDEDATGELAGLAKEFKLSQEEAQKVADVGAKLAAKWDAKQAAQIEQASTAWAEAATTDKEYGGDKLPESLASAKKALAAFGTPELQQLLDGSKLGNHPEVIRFMVRAGKAISEDRMVTGGKGPATAPTSTAKSLYPNQA